MNIAIIGGGIVGLALGYKLQCEKNNNIDIFEKEKRIGYHQSEEIVVYYIVDWVISLDL